MRFQANSVDAVSNDNQEAFLKQNSQKNRKRRFSRVTRGCPCELKKLGAVS